MWKQRHPRDEPRGSTTRSRPSARSSHSARQAAGRPEHASLLEGILATIEERATHLAAFLEGYARFARLPQPRAESVAWRPFLEGCTRWARSSSRARPPSEPGWFDPVQIQQVLINLLKNAQESGSPPEEIGVSVHLTAQGESVLRVVDRGRGMDASVMKRPCCRSTRPPSRRGRAWAWRCARRSSRPTAAASGSRTGRAARLVVTAATRGADREPDPTESFQRGPLRYEKLTPASERAGWAHLREQKQGGSTVQDCADRRDGDAGRVRPGRGGDPGLQCARDARRHGGRGGCAPGEGDRAGRRAGDPWARGRLRRRHPWDRVRVDRGAAGGGEARGRRRRGGRGLRRGRDPRGRWVGRPGRARPRDRGARVQRNGRQRTGAGMRRSATWARSGSEDGSGELAIEHVLGGVNVERRVRLAEGHERGRRGAHQGWLGRDRRERRGFGADRRGRLRRRRDRERARQPSTIRDDGSGSISVRDVGGDLPSTRTAAAASSTGTSTAT